MPTKRVSYYSYGSSTHCAETRKFIEDSGVILDVRDLEKNPFTFHEVRKLIGHISLKHFLNPNSDSYKKNKLDQNLPSREEVMQMFVDDYTLFKQPIIKSIRLMTIGCDKRKISEMLQLSFNGSNNVVPNGNTGPREDYKRTTVKKVSVPSSRK